MFHIRRLVAADAADYRDLRLEALERRPEAFSSSYVEDRGLPVARYAAALGEHMVFGGFRGDRLEGALALWRPSFVGSRHRAEIIGFYIRDGVPVSTLADRLVDAAVRGAGADVECLQARVTTDDNDMMLVFRRNEFETVGTEPRVFKLDDGRYLDQYVMWREVGAPSARKPLPRSAAATIRPRLHS